MNISSKLLVCALAPVALLLAACSGEPSNSEIKAAMDVELKVVNDEMQKQLTTMRGMPGGDKIPDMKIEIKEVKKLKCDKQNSGSYTCEVEIKMATPLPIGEQTIKAPINLTKEGSGWKAAGGVPNFGK